MLVPPGLVMLADGVAIGAVILLVWHVARRVPTAPKRVPLSLWFDGRPRLPAAKRWLWLLPGILVVVVAVVTLALAYDPPRDYDRLPITLALIVLAEVAAFMAWTIDRLIEIARGMTHRIAPTRAFVTLLPILATVALTIAVAIGQNL